MTFPLHMEDHNVLLRGSVLKRMLTEEYDMQWVFSKVQLNAVMAMFCATDRLKTGHQQCNNNQ